MLARTFAFCLLLAVVFAKSQESVESEESFGPVGRLPGRGSFNGYEQQRRGSSSRQDDDSVEDDSEESQEQYGKARRPGLFGRFREQFGKLRQSKYGRYLPGGFRGEGSQGFLPEAEGSQGGFGNFLQGRLGDQGKSGKKGSGLIGTVSGLPVVGNIVAPVLDKAGDALEKVPIVGKVAGKLLGSLDDSKKSASSASSDLLGGLGGNLLG